MNKKKAKIRTLFITRKYPPQVGGMENFSQGLISNYPGEKSAVTYGGSQKWLLFVYPYLFFKALFRTFSFKPDIIHMGDGVMTPMGFMLKLFTGRKVVFTAHGKDVNLDMGLYQAIMPFFFKKMDKVYCVSNSTVGECVKVGIESSNCTFIPNGVDMEEFLVEAPKSELLTKLVKKYDLSIRGKTVLITVGRLSKRKGVMWFVENVMPKLSKEYVYLVVGADATEISDLKSWFGYKKISYGETLNRKIQENSLDEQVVWLGKVPFSDLKELYSIADLFIMPNIKVGGDMEGFGIVAIEASSVGLPVIASSLEGITDAVKDGVTGSLVTSESSKEFIAAVEKWTHLIENDPGKREEIRSATRKHYSWQKVAKLYEEEFIKTVAGH